MVQIKVKKFSRSKTEIQPEIQPDIQPVGETKNNEEEVNEIIDLPIVNELDDLTNVNFNKKINHEAEEILKKVINKKKETPTPVESNPGDSQMLCQLPPDRSA